MTIAEFEEKYYLHDSSIEKIEYDATNKRLTLTIDFCFWMQIWYDKETPENGLISVIFDNVSLFEYEQHDFINILENIDTEVRRTEFENEVLKIFIFEYKDIEDAFWWIKIKADNVTVIDLKQSTV